MHKGQDQVNFVEVYQDLSIIIISALWNGTQFTNARMHTVQ